MYFVAIVTQNRACLFGEVADGEMRLNDAGRMVQSVWREIPLFSPGVDVDEFVVMPNHVHGIVVLTGGNPAIDPVGAGLVPAPGATERATTERATTERATTERATTRVARTLGDVIGRFKSRVTVEYTRGVKTRGWTPFCGRLWQRNYYEHVIRNEESLNRIRQYIRDNPQRWAYDRENPLATVPEPEDAWTQ